MKGALERKAQAVYDSLSPEAQDCARWIFLSLTQLGEGTEDTRRRILKSDLVVKKYSAVLVDRTLQSLTAAKLVVVATDSPDTGLDQTILTPSARSTADPLSPKQPPHRPNFLPLLCLAHL
ncbi:MAG: hypothetical protein HC772_17645 [Leptolyngbyaceae cyanobacterium CRU_2_3]|nr:hypothetical protein [Leptolyngbyaceae cyanobacterium CRU_2_3]